MQYVKDRLKKVFFEFNGEYSYDYFIDIIKWNHMDTPALLLEQERIPGAHKDTFYTEGNYENKVIDIECYLDIRHDLKSKDSHIKRIKRWLYGDYKYKELRFSDDSEGFYEGLCISNMLFEEVVEGLYRTLITFSCNPFKMIKHDDYVFNYKKREVNFINNSPMECPLKINIEYPNPENVSGFEVQVINTKYEIVYHFKCDAPVKNTKYLEVDSESFNIISTDINNIKESAISISKSFAFPYALKGDNKIRVNFNCDDEISYPTMKITFNELEL